MATRWLVVCSVLAVLGCGARVEVAKDKGLALVDELLGTVNVKRKEVEIGCRNMDAALDQLKEGKIEAKIKQAQFSDRQTELKAKIADADKALGRLRDYLKENKDVVLSGETFTPARLKEMAETAIDARKKLANELEGVTTAKDRLGAIVVSFEQREREGRERMKGLKQLLEEIDAKATALKSIKDASMLSGGTTFDFEKLEKQVKDLSIAVDGGLAFQDEKAKEAATIKESKSLESVVRQTSTADDAVSEIDKILGKR